MTYVKCTLNHRSYSHSFICLPKSNNNSEQTVGQDSKATQDALALVVLVSFSGYVC